MDKITITNNASISLSKSAHNTLRTAITKFNKRYNTNASLNDINNLIFAMNTISVYIGDKVLYQFQLDNIEL